jgi:putative Mg2+ transporter-C (MgtC) family protein
MMEISYGTARDYLLAGNAMGRMVDPTRVAAGVITGIGFLGAGVILRSRETIQGLTSAACIWMSATLGLAIGAGLYWQSITVSVVTHLALIFLKGMENRLSRDIYRMVSIEARDVENLFDKIKDSAATASVKIISDGFQRAKQDNSIKIELMVTVKDEKLVKDYCNAIYALEPVWRVSLERPY